MRPTFSSCSQLEPMKAYSVTTRATRLLVPGSIESLPRDYVSRSVRLSRLRWIKCFETLASSMPSTQGPAPRAQHLLGPPHLSLPLHIPARATTPLPTVPLCQHLPSPHPPQPSLGITHGILLPALSQSRNQVGSRVHASNPSLPFSTIHAPDLAMVDVGSLCSETSSPVLVP